MNRSVKLINNDCLQCFACKKLKEGGAFRQRAVARAFWGESIAGEGWEGNNACGHATA
jgi:hypothetical protein